MQEELLAKYSIAIVEIADNNIIRATRPSTSFFVSGIQIPPSSLSQICARAVILKDASCSILIEISGFDIFYPRIKAIMINAIIDKTVLKNISDLMVAVSAENCFDR